MKKFLRQLILTLGLSLYLTGCKEQESMVETKEVMNLDEIRQEAEIFSEEFQFENLDFSEATFDIPEVDSVKKVHFPIWVDSYSELEEKLIENLKKFTGLETIDRNKIKYNLREWGADSYVPETDEWIPCDELTDEEKEKAWYISYNDGRHTALLYMSTAMLEMSNTKMIAELAGIEEISQPEYGLRPQVCGTKIMTYELENDDVSNVSYHLLDEEVKLTDAIAYIEDELNEYHYFGSEILTNKVYKVDVMRLEDGAHYYLCYIKTIHEQMAFNHTFAQCDIISQIGEPKYLNLVASDHKAAMFYKGQMDYFWSSAQTYQAVETVEEYTELLSLWKATELLSKTLSDDKTFQISSVQLMYGAGFIPLEGNTIGKISHTEAYPIYQYRVKNPNISGYSLLYFDVNAVTGEIVWWCK